MVDILTGEESKEYEEELQYSVELYGADFISPSHGATRKLINDLKDWPHGGSLL